MEFLFIYKDLHDASHLLFLLSIHHDHISILDQCDILHKHESCLMQCMLLEPLLEVLGSLQNSSGSCRGQTGESNGDILGTR